MSPDVSRLESLFAACIERNDDVGNKLISYKSDIINCKVTIRYHRNRCSTYTSSHHMKRVPKTHVPISNPSSSTNSGDGPSRCYTRSCVAATFDWKQNCFICGDVCSAKHRSTWSMVESAISTKDPKKESMYTKVLNAAEKRQDKEMMARLHGVANGDLVAIEARYHRKKNCYTHYIDPKQIATQASRTENVSVFNQKVHELIKEFKPAIIENREVFLLSTLRDNFHAMLRTAGQDNVESYTSQKLKRQLSKEWPEISFIAQAGASDFVCSNDISVGDALHKANELTKLLEASADMDTGDFEQTPVQMTDESIVHQAVGILRKRIMQTKPLDNKYFSSDEMSLDAMREFVDPLLYKSIVWFQDKKSFDQAEDVSQKPNNLRCLNIACDITSLATGIMSPKHLGLAVNMHHNHGSRKLIDMMSANGYGISYTELRHFLTSSALHVASIKEPSAVGFYKPPQLTSNADRNNFITTAADNWDHNERTTDGKRTTHAMTSIFVQGQSDVQQQSPRIARADTRSLDPLLVPGQYVSLDIKLDCHQNPIDVLSF